jgi:topoisomerase-4 subunit B
MLETDIKGTGANTGASAGTNADTNKSANTAAHAATNTGTNTATNTGTNTATNPAAHAATKAGTNTATKPAAKYDESKIKTLSSLEHIRLRYGMYIGRLGDGSDHDDGIYILMKEAIDNAVDEYVMGYGKKVIIRIENNLVSVRDFGRGIPLGKLVDCVSRINTGAKYDQDVFRFSVGLNGVGCKAVNALSEHFVAKSFREGQCREISFAQGVLQQDRTLKTTEPDGTYIEFMPDRSIFPPYEFKQNLVEKRMWHYAYLNTGLSLHYNDQVIVSKRGLFDLLEVELAEAALYPIIHYSSERLEFSFTHTDNYGDTYYSFVNGQYTTDGGTHQSAFREGTLKGINDYAAKSFNAADVRDGMVGAISIRINEPIFESQTKNKLGNTDIRSWIVGEVKDHVSDFLHKNPEIAESVLRKIAANERVRLELQGVKKEAKELAKKTSIKVPNLRDCKRHRGDNSSEGENTMIFITEGQSAAGSMITCRNVMTQAIFSLKGKPLNCYDESLSRIYKNEELYNIMKALGIEESIDDLRFQKIVLATDSDVDGLHIRNLLLTYFLKFFEPLVQKRHIFILETPLFRVRDQKKTLYCYSEKEKESAIRKLGQKAEITRFKGLGEISPKEFGQFIGRDIRLIQVIVDELKKVPEILQFYMGKNTPERKEYIMENLV